MPNNLISVRKIWISFKFFYWIMLIYFFIELLYDRHFQLLIRYDWFNFAGGIIEHFVCSLTIIFTLQVETLKLSSAKNMNHWNLESSIFFRLD